MSHAAKLLQAAIAHHQAGKLDDAEKTYRKVLRVAAADADALRLLGGLYLQTRQWASAVACLEKAARLRPADPETLTNYGIALYKSARRDEAVAQYERALALRPDYLSALTNLATLYQENGDPLRAAVLFARAVAAYPGDAALHYNHGNALFAAGRAGDAAEAYEQALRLKPDYLEAMINLGMALSQMGRSAESGQWLDVARSWFDKALQADPHNVVAMNNVANVLRQQGRAAEAVDYYQRALALKPDYVEAAINLSTSLRDLNRYEEAIDYCRRALALRPNSADARINLGTLLQDLTRHEEAVSCFAEALRLKPASVDAKWNQTLSLLALGRYAEGFELYECGLGVTHMRGDNFMPHRRWNGEDITGKRLLIWSEQGFGDSLQFIRYAQLCKARGATVIVVCPPPLRRLFAACGFIDALPADAVDGDFDVHAPMMSLPYIFGTRLETVPAQGPYLRTPDDARAQWAARFPARTGNLRVGLVWAGNPRENQINAHLTDRRRSMALEMLRPLFDVAGVDFYSLQMGAAAVAQIDVCGLRSRIADIMGDVRDFADTAAIIENLDLVISVDTSVVHLAGGLGKPVWVMSRFDACWRWLQNRPDNPWYPSARVFGQPAPGDWAIVVEKVRAALLTIVSA
ncbi:MAG: tetratricopeptide repeat protein [Alphaproteobacteria bacterium]|nr:tetratricopeptide repeat protein [Alphaproteobacteria bacterium]